MSGARCGRPMFVALASALVAVGGCVQAGGAGRGVPTLDDIATLYPAPAEEPSRAEALSKMRARGFSAEVVDALKTTPAPPSPEDEQAERERRMGHPHEVYRPWQDRFEAKPLSGRASSRMWPEYRKGYKRFQSNAPGYPGQPNSADLDTETSVILIVVVAGLGTAALAGLAATRLGVDRKVEDQLEGFFIVLSVPAVLGTLWMYYVALKHFVDPVRNIGGYNENRAPEAWCCRVLVWYLLLGPAVTVVNFASQFTMLIAWHERMRQSPLRRHSPRRGEQQPERGIEEMTDTEYAMRHLKGVRGNLKQMVTYKDRAEDIFRRLILMVVNIAVLCFGFYLTMFGENTCEPEVWWAAFVFTAVMSVVLAVAILATFAAACLHMGNEDLRAFSEAMRAQYGAVFREDVEDEPFGVGRTTLDEGEAPSDPAASFATVIMQPGDSVRPAMGATPSTGQPEMRWETGYGSMRLDGTLPPYSLPGSAQRPGLEGAMY